MNNTPWFDPSRNTHICVDGYENGVLQGRLLCGEQYAESFHSLSRFLLRMEQLLDGRGAPQAYTELRSFSQVPPLEGVPAEITPVSRGALATFSLQVLFRQNSSWQGELLWVEKDTRQSFRSVLELVRLLDSALR